MERDQEQKHVCKFCSKRFPCGRSLGGHMRSHLINIPSSVLRRNDEKPPKKKLPPLSHGFDQGKKKKSKVSSIQEKACKDCGKKFQSWKALFGHMKWHSPNSKTSFATNDEDSWSDDLRKQQIMDSQSDNEGTTPLCRRYKSATITNSSSSLTVETDHHEQEEVALSLIILSKDKGDWGRLDSVVESSDFDSKSFDDEGLKLKELQPPPRTGAKMRKLEALNHGGVENGCNEFEVNSPKNPIKSQFEREKKSKPSRKRNSSILSQEIEKNSSKFSCSICKKGFPSYQALGGHRASHKKFKGCCAPREEENSFETENSHNRSEKNLTMEVKSKKGKDHECPICFRVFPSGQALGGHKRSHLILDQIKKNASPSKEKPLTENRAFLDLNLPAPAAEEEEEEEFKPWWIGGGGGGEMPLLGLLSTS